MCEQRQVHALTWLESSRGRLDRYLCLASLCRLPLLPLAAALCCRERRPAEVAGQHARIAQHHPLLLPHPQEDVPGVHHLPADGHMRQGHHGRGWQQLPAARCAGAGDHHPLQPLGAAAAAGDVHLHLPSRRDAARRRLKDQRGPLLPLHCCRTCLPLLLGRSAAAAGQAWHGSAAWRRQLLQLKAGLRALGGVPDCQLQLLGAAPAPDHPEVQPAPGCSQLDAGLLHQRLQVRRQQGPMVHLEEQPLLDQPRPSS